MNLKRILHRCILAALCFVGLSSEAYLYKPCSLNLKLQEASIRFSWKKAKRYWDSKNWKIQNGVRRYFRHKVSARYKNYPLLLTLAYDPAHRAVRKGSLAEAVAILQGVRAKLVSLPIRRGPPEIDFIDGEGQEWDVKIPRRNPGEERFFAKEVAGNIVRQLIYNPDIRVLLSVHNLNLDEAEELYRELRWSTFPSQWKRIEFMGF